MRYLLLQGDVLQRLHELADESIHCVVTSPPYWGLRDYGVDGQIGLEPTPEEYVRKLVSVFRQVRRALRRDGTVWLNVGDTYYGVGGTTAVRIADTAPNDRSFTEVPSRIRLTTD